MMNDTICAISTPAGIGGIAVIRVSGPAAIDACSSIFKPMRAAHDLKGRATHTLTFGQIVRPSAALKAGEAALHGEDLKDDGEVIDEVVMALYRAPHSFTGEDVVEISCHGSLYIQEQILQLLTTLPRCENTSSIYPALETPAPNVLTPNAQTSSTPLVRLAEHGEFTRRAFASGRFDLAQAEAVADLISAQSAAAHRLAMQQMKGSVSQKLASLHDQLLQLTALLELELDFSEEDVEFADRTHLVTLANEIDAEVMRLANTFQRGQAIKNGIPVAIIGAPNVGKSTLLNALLKEDRAIVSDIQGTTRDLIEDTITLGGFLFRFIDTAGIRHTDDTIEQLGIDRSHQAVQRAQIILLVTEPGIDYPQIDKRNDQHIIYILNKVDKEECESLAPTSQPIGNAPDLQSGCTSPLRIAAKNNTGIADLEAALIDCVKTDDTQQSVILTNARHYEALITAHEALSRVVAGLNSGLSNEFVDMDLKEVISAMNQILGREITSQDTLNSIFSSFCIGK